jgi:hypothetical protein
MGWDADAGDVSGRAKCLSQSGAPTIVETLIQAEIADASDQVRENECGGHGSGRGLPTDRGVIL